MAKKARTNFQRKSNPDLNGQGLRDYAKHLTERMAEIRDIIVHAARELDAAGEDVTIRPVVSMIETKLDEVKERIILQVQAKAIGKSLAHKVRRDNEMGNGSS